MRRIFMLLGILCLCGCAATNNALYTKNPNCTGVKEVKVFQVVREGALAQTNSYDQITVYLPKSERYQLYEGAKIRRQDNECIVYDGVYKYITANKENPREKTVPIVKFEKRWLDME